MQSRSQSNEEVDFRSLDPTFLDDLSQVDWPRKSVFERTTNVIFGFHTRIPVEPLLDQTRQLRFASTIAYCHSNPGLKRDLDVFLELNNLNLKTEEDLRANKNDPYDFSFVSFTAEVMLRQNAEFREQFYSQATPGPLINLMEQSQSWRED